MGNLLALCMARTKNTTTKVPKINLLLKTVDQARPTTVTDEDPTGLIRISSLSELLLYLTRPPARPDPAHLTPAAGEVGVWGPVNLHSVSLSE